MASTASVTPARRAVDRLGPQTDHDLLVTIASQMSTLTGTVVAMTERMNDFDRRFTGHLLEAGGRDARIKSLEEGHDDNENALKEMRKMVEVVTNWHTESVGQGKLLRVGGTVVALLVGILTIVELLIFFNSHIHIGFTAFSFAMMGLLP